MQPISLIGMDTRTSSDRSESESTEDEEAITEYDTAKKKKIAFIGGSKNGRCDIGGGCGGSGGGRASALRCRAQGCAVDLNDGKTYHRRHKVCEVHAKAEAVIVAGLRQRFCQQCSRFHELSEFDFMKRSCRMRLAGHNERRRKSSTESPGEGRSNKNNTVRQNQNDETNIENHYYQRLHLH